MTHKPIRKAVFPVAGLGTGPGGIGAASIRAPITLPEIATLSIRHGLSERLTMLGNAVLPQCGEVLGHVILGVRAMMFPRPAWDPSCRLPRKR